MQSESDRAASPLRSEPGAPTSATHLPALDGLRGVAVLLVIFAHSACSATDTTVDRVYRGVISAGWTGVDLFFVLSGFLITGILYDAKGTRGYFRNFYSRRALRIFPLYYAFLLVYVFLLPCLPFTRVNVPKEYNNFLGYWMFYLTNFAEVFVGEIRQIYNADLAVFWTLA